MAHLVEYTQIFFEMEDSTIHIDSFWYKALMKNHTSLLKCLNGDYDFRIRQYELFIKGNIINPTLDYPFINENKIVRYIKRYELLKLKISNEENNKIIKFLYLAKIQEYISELEIVKSIKQENREVFVKNCEKLYGKIKNNILLFTVEDILIRLNDRKNKKNDLIKLESALVNIKTFLEVKVRLEDRISTPSNELFQKISKIFIEKYSRVFDLIPIVEEEYNSSKIRKIFRNVISELHITGGKVRISNMAFTDVINFSPQNLLIEIPLSKTINYQRLRELIAHEIICHMQRAFYGGLSFLQLLSIGLPGYYESEEGLGVLFEQLIGEKFDTTVGESRYLAIALAQGFDGQAKDFREVFEIMLEYYQLFLNENESNEVCEKQAWTDCLRVFRGTDAKTRGQCFIKDLSYRNGNIHIWEWLKNNEFDLDFLISGKFDLTNQNDFNLVKKLSGNERI